MSRVPFRPTSLSYAWQIRQKSQNKTCTSPALLLLKSLWLPRRLPRRLPRKLPRRLARVQRPLLGRANEANPATAKTLTRVPWFRDLTPFAYSTSNISVDFSDRLFDRPGPLKNGFVTATKLGTTSKFLLLQPKLLLQQPNVLLIKRNILFL